MDVEETKWPAERCSIAPEKRGELAGLGDTHGEGQRAQGGPRRLAGTSKGRGQQDMPHSPACAQVYNPGENLPGPPGSQLCP